MTGRYLYCGLLLESSLAFPELTTPFHADRASDLLVRLAKVPRDLPSTIYRTATYDYNGSEALWRLDGVANYRIREGGVVIDVDPADGADLASVRLFLLHSVFAMASILRGQWMLAASAVARNGLAQAFIGPSASGKSTAAASLLQQGYHLVADSLLRISRDRTGEMVAHPQAGWLHLWPDAIKRLGYDISNTDELRHGIAIRRVMAQPIEKPIRLSHIFVLADHPRDSQKCLGSSTSSGTQAFESLIQHVAGSTWIKNIANRQSLFQWAVQIATSTTIHTRTLE